MMKRVIVALGLFASGVRAAPVGTSVTIDRTIVRIDDAVIWESDVAVLLAAPGASDRATVIEELINEELVLAEGRRRKVEVEDSEVTSAINDIKQQNKLDDAGLDAELARQGYTRARYERSIKRQLNRLRTVNLMTADNVSISDSEVVAEAVRRKLPTPLSSSDKDTVRRELRRAAADAFLVEWFRSARTRTVVQRRP